MTMEKIHTDKAPAAIGPYSQAIVHAGVLYTSGQIAINPETSEVEAKDIEGQTHQICRNLGEVLKQAGSKTVYELHGSVHRNYCLKCGKSYSAEDILRSEGVPRCECGGIIKPDVVLYGENLDDRTVTGALAAIESCDTLIIGGTSLTVYPAAGFIRYFGGRNLVLINMSATPYDSRADLAIHDKVGEVLDKIKVN